MMTSVAGGPSVAAGDAALGDLVQGVQPVLLDFAEDRVVRAAAGCRLYTRKNWLPLVFGPLLAIAKVPLG